VKKKPSRTEKNQIKPKDPPLYCSSCTSVFDSVYV